ncbi:MAG: Gfo/Idh/MocA family protein [Candidatus Brocadiales bacterium]
MTKLAIVGAGYWGPNLIRNFLKINPKLVHAVCERNDVRRTSVAKTHPKLRFFKDYSTLLKDNEIDSVVIAVQPAFHYEMTRSALLSGKHVFVEKPLALTGGECRELIRLAEDCGLTLMVGHIFEYNAAVRKVKEIINTGTLGDIYYLYSERTDLGTVKADVNAMWNIAPHDISIMLYWLGQEPTCVSAHGYSYLQKGVEDVVHISMEFPSGINAEIHVSWLSPKRVRSTTIVGSKNMIIYDELNHDGKVKVIKNELCANGFDQKKDKYVKKRGEVTTPELEDYEPLYLECKHFVECIESGLRPLTDGECGLRVVKVLETAQVSLKRGGKTVAIAN